MSSRDDFDINMDEITELVNDLRKNNKNGSKSRWTPSNGTTTIRIVPYAKNHGNPFVRLYFHWNIAKTPLLSPISYGNPDPIKEASEALLEKAKTGTKEDWIFAKKLEPSLRTYVPIIVRGEEEAGVKWWGFGKAIFEELIEVIQSGDYGNPIHPITGHDIKVEKKSKEEAGNDYGKTTVRVMPKETPITNDKELLKSILTDQPEIESLYPAPSYEELQKALEIYLNPEKEDDEEEEISNEINSIIDNNEQNDDITETNTDSVFGKFDDVLAQLKSNNK
jgi:hypothetical protein